jgi:hypothetical protein
MAAVLVALVITMSIEGSMEELAQIQDHHPKAVRIMVITMTMAVMVVVVTDMVGEVQMAKVAAAARSPIWTR